MIINTTFAVMQNKQAIILLFIANIISGLAQGISMIAIPWYFVEVVSRPEVFASAYLLITFLTLFWGLYAGTLVDRYSRKNLFIIVNLICGLLTGAISCYGFQIQYLPDLLVLLVFGITIFNYNVHCDLTLVFVKVDPMFPKFITKSTLESLGKIAEDVFRREIDI